MRPAVILRVEGLVVFAAAIAIYVDSGFSAVAFVVLFLVPDASFLGFIASPAIGAAAYNAMHTYALPLALAVAGVLAGADTLVQVALIWSAHIGLDHLLGYGLRYPAGREESHLDRV